MKDVIDMNYRYKDSGYIYCKKYKIDQLILSENGIKNGCESLTEQMIKTFNT